ncbi:MAG: pyruvate dehydrogenase (acetyl-transferring), homodimeric type [Candidatus Eremiobacteraeota bacterium]|nr:pyruvate dehydrogenase (acetyl-transferring), homodimeric type [Candidatus Eremiobacteraeota bacterium]MBC5803195.1 pyruvate dehydrogenase (acetyl-transferring), homodimeric type [Candidatus Eremiobacteraeota bacterium]MBC5821243.1 pyruvate dehydrogenase (acetyl-transferring), homodimeric type [Candidatus Eremiobacteraeota bacterium]
MLSTPVAANGVAPSSEGDPQETQEWLDAIDGVLAHEGPARATELLERIVERAQTGGAQVELGVQTPYVNTIPPSLQPRMPGNEELETRIRHFLRWNAMAMVVRANETSSELGGHVASFASSATLYDVGFNHFFRAPSEQFGGDLVFFQGHSAPGVYARAYLEGRISEEQLANFRQEVDGHGLSSYPHSWLMPDFWQFATVSMGLGPIQAIYQARFLKYLHNRGIAGTEGRKVWCFLGDGEVDEPESLGAISVASRERLDNLIFVVNCNLQRLDGPVRGNGKIIQELERQFRGNGWNVIKVIWGRGWDELLARDHSGRLIQVMTECVDGEYQTFKANDGAYVREHFFGRYPETAAMVADWTDEQIWDLKRGGHDARKVYAAYVAATKHTGEPTVVLAKTIKGYGMGSSGEAQNVAHQQKHLDLRAMRQFRDRFAIPISDADLAKVPFYRPPDDSPEAEYLRERTSTLGYVPQRRRTSSKTFAVPDLSLFGPQLQGSGEREMSTTMVFTRLLSALVKDKALGKRVVPIVADESRTFGMEGMFRQLGIFSPLGQLYKPQDAAQLMYYREDVAGQILQEGISEAGAMCSWIAAATSYSTSDEPMIPLFIFYSMFGFQRIGDLAWAAGDMRSRGFLIGGTSGRTTLNGEGLQHEDGHSQLFAAFIPNCVSYDPTFAYELAVIVRDGLRRMIGEHQDVYYYITVLNENYVHPAMPAGVEEAIVKGMYLLRDGSTVNQGAPRVQLLGSGAILREVIAAANLLRDDYGIAADVWSATSFNELRRNGLNAERWNLLHPEEQPRIPYVTEQLATRPGPVVAASDYIKSYADGIRPFVPRRFHALGTDGYGRSDYRRKLRAFFEVDRRWVALAALGALAAEGAIARETVGKARDAFGIDAEKPNPVTV